MPVKKILSQTWESEAGANVTGVAAVDTDLETLEWERLCGLG
jgi:hypothetical protein